MGSAIGAVFHAPESSSSDRVSIQPVNNSLMLSCRKRRAVSSKKKTKHEAWWVLLFDSSFDGVFTPILSSRWQNSRSIEASGLYSNSLSFCLKQMDDLVHCKKNKLFGLYFRSQRATMQMLGSILYMFVFGGRKESLSSSITCNCRNSNTFSRRKLIECLLLALRTDSLKKILDYLTGLFNLVLQVANRVLSVLAWIKILMFSICLNSICFLWWIYSYFSLNLYWKFWIEFSSSPLAMLGYDAFCSNENLK